MADTLPKIKVTDPSVAGRGAFQIQENGSSTTVDGMPYITPIALSRHTENPQMLTPGFIGPLSNKKLVAKLRSPTSPSAQPTADSQNGYVGDGTGLFETPIDPLSQQILQRTNTSPAVQKLRSQNTEPLSSQSPTSPNDVNADKKLNGETPRDASGGKADKKKVSFLSRFIGGNKKKSSTLDGASENGSEADDLRLEGMDAQLYVDNFSFSPKIPHPPAYIKVRTKFKKEKEFDRVFLAQELRSGSDKKSPPAAGSNPAPQSGSAATQNPIWAVEFSKDGRYIAVGGQDRVIRVWAVIESSSGRRAHENADNGEAKYLSAPVFHQKPVREYQGHTSTILDLSWSKAS
ncbi:unnamed protein product [Alternaria alternata]